MANWLDVEGDMTTLSDGSRAIINAKVYGYTDSDGNLLYNGPLLKGLDSATPWDWMVNLTVYPVQTPSSRYAQPMDDEDPLGGGGIDTSGVQIYQTSTISDAVAQPLGTVIQLCSKPISSVDSTGSVTLGEDNTSDTLQVAYSNAATADPTSRVSSVVGTLDTDGVNPVLDVDSGPNYDVQESYQGNIQFASAGTIANAKTFPDGSVISLGTTSAGEIVTRAWQDSFYIEEDNRSNGIQIRMTAHGRVPGDRAYIQGTVQTDSTTNERYINASTASLAGSGQVGPLGMNNKMLGGGNFACITGTSAPGQAGISGASGLNNIGLLAKSWGTVTAIDSSASPQWFEIDDGSRVFPTVAYPPYGYAAGDYVCIAGISSMRV